MKALLLALTLLAPIAFAENSLPPLDPNDAEITIRHDEARAYYEYRVNGQLKEIKVVPKNGKPYYLKPAGGERYIRIEESQFLVPSWVLFRW